jgi:hypothetical protein
LKREWVQKPENIAIYADVSVRILDMVACSAVWLRRRCGRRVTVLWLVAFGVQGLCMTRTLAPEISYVQTR